MKTFLQNLTKTILTLTVICNLQLANAQTQISTDIDGEAEYDASGNSVSLSSDGSTVAIGAPYNDGNGTDSGHVRIYKNTLGTWTQIGSDIDGEAGSDKSGWSVSLSADGSIVAIGAYRNIGNGLDSGHVRVYKNIANVWTQIGTDINGEAAYDNSGFSISLSSDGNTVAIGSPHNEGNGIQSGQVRIYKNIAGTWTQVGADIDGESIYNNSGWSVSLSADGSIVAIVAHRQDGSGYSTIYVKVFKNIGSTWTQVGTNIYGKTAYNESGWSVSLSADGSTIAFGDYKESSYVRIYKNIAGSWTQVGDDINDDANIPSNSIVSLSSDGNTLAIGRNNIDPEYVRIYKNIAGSWVQIGININKEVTLDYTGNNISLSSDGSKLAIGEPFNIVGNIYYVGRVRVYDLSSLLSSNSFVQSNFSIYPNPTSDRVNISLQENLQLEKVNIYNTLGQMVKTEKQNQINVSTLSKGSYFIEVITNKGKATKGFIVD